MAQWVGKQGSEALGTGSNRSLYLNNYIGADNTSETRYDFDWYNPHLYQGTTGIRKAFLIIVFEVSEFFCHAAVEIYISTNKKFIHFFFPLHY